MAVCDIGGRIGGPIRYWRGVEMVLVDANDDEKGKGMLVRIF